MDDFIELILELLLEGSIDALPNKKISLVITINRRLMSVLFSSKYYVFI